MTRVTQCGRFPEDGWAACAVECGLGAEILVCLLIRAADAAHPLAALSQACGLVQEAECSQGPLSRAYLCIHTALCPRSGFG